MTILNRQLLIFVVGLLGFAAFNADVEGSERADEEKKERVEVQAVVVEYVPRALREFVDDGSYTFDGVRLKVRAPMEKAGELTIYLNQPADEKSPWRAVGKTVRFRIDADALEVKKNRQLFDGGVEGLELAKDSGR